VLAAVWGAESDFGRRRGEHDLLAFWATRAAVGDGFRDDQFAEAARLVVAGAVPRSALRAFPDGSTGQVRWFPTQYAAMAADGDRDGLADIWRSAPDAVASVAGRLSGGWEPGGWLAEIVLPRGADPQTQRLLQALHREASIRPDYVRRADGQPWSEADRVSSGKLMQPEGASGPAYLALRNFTPLQYLAGDYRGRYTNETLSAAWALAIGLLANRIAAAA
jgi:membrane-bound lytic murein transglycosylase B